MAIWDVCLFSGEVDHLLIRLTELKDVVDHFVVVESTVSFQGQPKELILPTLSGGLFDRIIPTIIEDCPGMGGPAGGAGSDWFMRRERHMRDAMSRGYQGAVYDDMIMISDVDEIPTVAAVEEANHRLNGTEHILVFCQDMYVWNRRWLWPGPSWNTCVFLASSPTTPQHARDSRGWMIERNLIVKDAGWHLTWQGSIEEKRHKLSTFSHAEHLDKIDDLERLQAEGVDINGVTLQPVDLAGTVWPRYFDENPELWT